MTGAGRGIGRAIALRLAREGVSVAVTDLNEGDASAVAAAIAADGGEGFALEVNVTAKDEIQRMVRLVVERFGQLNILVNNAWIGAVGPLLDTDEATWDALMSVNAKGTLLCAQ